MIKTLIVDDSMIFRKILADLLAPIPDIEIVGQAPNGKIALQKILKLKPDLVLLDLDMPEMNGLEVIEAMKKSQVESGVIVISSGSFAMNKMAIKALDAGAFEFLTKPVGDTIEETRNLLNEDLKEAIRAFIHRLKFRIDLQRRERKLEPEILNASQEFNKDTSEKKEQPVNTVGKVSLFDADLIVIGISTGGPPALIELFSQLNCSLKTPIIVVQHIPAKFSEALAVSIREKSSLKVEEAKNNMELEQSTLYIAPGGKHLGLMASEHSEGYYFKVSEGPPVNNCRPSIDYLIETVIKNYGGKTAFFIMTGMGTDGLVGARLIKNARGYVVAQSEKSCVVYGMPKAVIEAGLANEVLSLSEIRIKIERLSLRKLYQSKSAEGISEN